MKSKKNLSVNVDSLSELGNTISETVYNCLNQPLTVTDAMGKATTYTYNALGKVESVTDSLNHRTEFTYNSRGQNTEVRDATNNVSSATYDLLGNVTRLAGPLGGATNYTYDDMGRLTSESTVSGGTKSYEYNELNVRKKITNARGQLRQIFYDSMGRITGYTSPEGSVSYTYDANGNVLTVVDSHGTITRTYDALNRVSSYTDTYGKVIRYEYDAVGNLSRVIYPDNTAVTYAYDANHNLVRVTDWANRVTSYTYDANNRVVGVTKPDGSMTNTVYDNKQRVTSTVERTAGGVVITGFEYTYDDMSRIIEEKILANSTKMCYTYDSLNRVTARTVKNATTNEVISTETFTYDTAGNITDAPDSCFSYDTNNRLIVFNGNSVSYDLDGNMLDNGEQEFTYDSANKLVTADGHTYTYNAEDVRIRNFCTETDTSYTYDTNARLSKLLMKTTNGVTTKYVYGRGLIGEELNNAFKTYHFDCRGSTIAITDISGNITDTFVYDTYGKLLSRTGTSFVIFGYNGRDGVVTDANGLIYMRARYYSPEMKRFVNADIVAGQLSNAITLNRFAYANGNPVSLIDPFGLSAERGTEPRINYYTAVFVSDKRGSSGLPIVGHTRLYFLGDNGIWYRTEFAGTFPDKSSAHVVWAENSIPDVFDVETGIYKDIDDVEYVVWNGNFNDSVTLAKQYAGKDPNGNNKDFGEYNFLFNNCSDYTDAILDVAQINGYFSQSFVDGDSPISVPAIREWEASLWDDVDTVNESVGNTLNEIGNAIEANVEVAVDYISDGLETVGNHIEEGAKYLWDKISFWD